MQFYIIETSKAKFYKSIDLKKHLCAGGEKGKTIWDRKKN